MNKFLMAAAAAAMTVGVAACNDMSGSYEADAASIAGSWKANVDSAQFENDTRNWVLADGVFDCQSCLPPYQVTANGEWQTVDRPGYDSQNIAVVDENTVTSAVRKGEDDLGNSTWTVSEDGQSMTIAFNDLSGDEPVTGSTNYSRTSAGPDGSHAVSGEWTVSNIGEISDAGLLFDYTLDGDQYGSSGNGISFVATLGGEAVAIEGSNSGTMVAVAQTGDGAYRETYSRDGETVGVTDITIDGDTMSVVSTDPRDNSVVRWTATRQ